MTERGEGTDDNEGGKGKVIKRGAWIGDREGGKDRR